MGYGGLRSERREACDRLGPRTDLRTGLVEGKVAMPYTTHSLEATRQAARAKAAHPRIRSADRRTENQRLADRVRELEHLLELERSRSAGLERGLSALSERLSELRKEART
jgi:hypothetical protein